MKNIQLFKCFLFGALISIFIISYHTNACSSDQDSSGSIMEGKSVDSENTNKWTPFLLTVTNKYQIPKDIFDVYGVRVNFGFGREQKTMTIAGLDFGFVQDLKAFGFRVCQSGDWRARGSKGELFIKSPWQDI